MLIMLFSQLKTYSAEGKWLVDEVIWLGALHGQMLRAPLPGHPQHNLSIL